jgi:predicted enzyme related to lactoylglutathione lyase
MNKHRFVWHDLNTKDLAGSKAFYSELFGWTYESSASSPYLHIKTGDRMIGGMRAMGPNEPGPPSWLGYIGVDDVAKTVASITAAGGRVYMPTTTMENVGTFAVVADPTGGVFAPWKSARAGEDAEPKGPWPAFSFCWDELSTTNVDAATGFYAKVFGWEPKPQDMGGGMIYTLLRRPGVTNPKGEPVDAGGVMKSPPGVPASFWLTYVAVDNTDQRTEKAVRLGAKVLVPPTDIPNVGRFSCWTDPQGAMLGLLEPAPM